MYQITMVIGAFMLLSLLTITVNHAMIDKIINTYQSESTISASTMANSLMQEVCLRAFDRNTITTQVDSASRLYPSLGNNGETYPSFDDLDDFKNYTRLDTARNGGIFKSKVNVVYVNPDTPGDSTNSRTFYKKVTVTVVNIDSTKMLFPVSLTTVVSY